MNGKPKTYGAMQKAVGYCTHPDLDGVDIAILGCFARYADAAGRNSFPGNVNLCAASRLGQSSMLARVAKLRDKYQLIEMTQKGDGRGNASEYRVCLESSHFPDRAPGGGREWFIDQPSGRDRKVSHMDDSFKPSCPDRNVSEDENPPVQL